MARVGPQRHRKKIHVIAFLTSNKEKIVVDGIIVRLSRN